MPPTKTRLQKITTESVRKSTLKKKFKEITNKINQLSILCDIKAAVIITDKRNGNEQTITLWPSKDEVTSMVEKFLSFPKEERSKKMIQQEKYLEGMLDKTNEKVLQLEKKNEEMETRCIVYELMNGSKNLEELDMKELNYFSQFAEKKLEDIQKRIHELEPEGESSCGAVDQMEVEYDDNLLLDDLLEEMNAAMPEVPDESG